MSDINSIHQLSVGDTCPGRIIYCVDEPDSHLIEYVNDDFENDVTAYFIIGSVDSNDVGNFVLEWEIDCNLMSN